MNIAIQNSALSVNIIDGRRLAHQIKYSPARVRARVACELSAGALVLRSPTKSQSARLLGVSEQAVSAIARSRRLCVRPMTDAAIERLIGRVGADRFMNALDRITAPLTP